MKKYPTALENPNRTQRKAMRWRIFLDNKYEARDKRKAAKKLKEKAHGV